MVVLDKPDQIAAWHFMSRLYALAGEINTDGKIKMTPGGWPVLRALHAEGMLESPIRNTQKNRAIVLRIMVNLVLAERPNWNIQGMVLEALLTDEQKAATR